MITITVNGEEFECEVAVKGPDFIQLYDADSVLVASWFEIVDFDEFEISGGDWTPYVEEVLTIRGATLSSGLILLDGYAGIETGSIIKIRAPGDSKAVTQGISIDGEVFSILNAMGENLAGQAGVWASGAILSLLVDKVNSATYMMNGGDSGGFIEMTTSLPVADRKPNTLYGLILANYGGGD